ncbi:DNA mismatch repair protein msh2, putative [Acanthamoeba castellanii str. Neff]|uniref:DNA mismatch repair protein msh2, putative n=1 Tax=Acanthamoeba castellanii (strain ATCC 30010 / Neff) TaxID=1257118 RepID=L8HJ01_ACACF|nr:DNA mismatch repair protein msh2, putative [Acanthamoeba castellanii str. Neff]ELR24658.1 DNA mismatch repair protein msh2, putative [Acanthamoeba castellanii str. Neff]
METTTGLTFAVRHCEQNGPNYYHTAHGEDALLIANDYYHTTDAITYLGAEGPDGRGGIPSQAISPSLFVDIVRDLLVNKRNRIEVWAVPTGGPKNTQNNWQIIKRASPGNIHDFEDLMFQDDVGAAGADNPITLALQFGFKDGQRMVGAAFIDLNTRTLNVCEFIDDDHLSNVYVSLYHAQDALERLWTDVGRHIYAPCHDRSESLVVQVGATECLLAQEDEAETTRILTVLEACNVLDTPKRKGGDHATHQFSVRRGEFAIHTLEQDLTTLLALPPLQHNYDEMQKQFAMGAAACLIRHFELLSDSNNINKWHLKSHNFGQYMRLDRTAFVTLHLIPEGKEKRSMSLFSLLNHCRTPMGSRRLVQWIKQNIVELFFDDHELRGTLQENLLKRVPDVNRLMRKIVKGNAGLQDILRLYQFVEKLVGIHMALSFYAGEHKDLITAKYEEPLAELIESFKQFEAMVETMVDLSLIDQHEYRIRPDFDDDLKEFYKGLQKSKQKMEDLRSRIADDLKLDSKELKLESSKHVGYFFRLTARNEKLIRNRKDFIRVEGQKKDGVKFRNSDLHRLNEDYKKFNRSYEQKQAQIVASVVTTTSTYQQPMERASEIIADLDAFVSMAHVSANWRYTRPQLTEPGVGDIIIKGSRHPCLETMDQINFIANDVNLTRESRVQIITGPNMGGKSTYIRQVAMVVLMAQMGCFVPAESASISIVDAILVRVGAGDSQLRGISTFMAEMLETAAILRSATSKSLICIDELGRGTSTYDGFGLAWAISRHIAKEIKAFCLFATHFHELTSLADEIPHVANLHVTAQTGDEDKLADLTFLYQIRPGACDQSFGIHVAKMTNFPEEIVKVAEAKAAELESFDTVLVKEHQLSPSKRLANKGKQKADEASSPAAQDQSSSDADELAGVAERLLQDMEVAGLDQLPRAEAMEKIAALVARIDQAKANNPRLAALLANTH